MTIDEEQLKNTVANRQLSIAVLLLGGLVLVVMGQAVYGVVYPHNRVLLVLVVLVGVGVFVFGGYLISGRPLPRRLIGLGQRLTGFFAISTGQLLLLLLAPCFGLLAALAAGDEFLALDLPVSVMAWLIAVCAALLGSYRSGKGVVPVLDRKDVWIASTLFLFALLLRISAIGTIPSTLSGDEGSAGLMAIKFLNGEANNIFTVGWFSFPNLYFALQSLGIAVLGQTVSGLRVTSAIAGALTVVGLYFLARTLFDRTVAILAGLFLAAFHYHIHFSRIGLNNIWDGFFAVVILGAIWHGWRTGRRSSFMVGGLALGLGQYFYVSIRIFPLLLMIWVGLAYLVDRQRFKSRLADLILAAYIAFVVVLPLILFFLRHPAEFNAPMQRVTIFNGWLEQVSLLENKPAALIIGDQMVDTALGFTHLPLRHWYNPGSPLLLATAAGLFLLGLFWALIQLDLSYMLIFLPLAAVVVAGSLSQDAPASQRYIVAAPLVALLVALPMAITATWLSRNWPRYRMLVLAGLGIFTSWLILNDIHYYFFEVYDHYTLGGLNTQVATEVAKYLNTQEPPPSVYFFGYPRMGYYSLSTIPYLAPEVEGNDILEPLTTTPGWRLNRPTVFVFLPERENELVYVRNAFPEGLLRVNRQQNGDVLFTTYEVPYP